MRSLLFPKVIGIIFFISALLISSEKKLLKSVIDASEKVTVLIGPEGDFSSDEINKALMKKIIPITLGKSRLRTETAALVAVNSVSFINE